MKEKPFKERKTVKGKKKKILNIFCTLKKTEISKKSTHKKDVLNFKLSIYCRYIFCQLKKRGVF